MEKIVHTQAQSPIGAASIQHGLSQVPGMPEIVSVTTNYDTRLDVCVEFKSEPSAATATLVHSSMITLALPARKEAFAKKMSEDVRAAIVGGILSSATGTAYWYDTDEQDQMNFAGAATGITAAAVFSIPGAPQQISWHVRSTKDGPKTMVMHTPAQIIQVGLEVMGFKELLLAHFNAKLVEMGQISDMQVQDAFEAAWNPFEALA